MEQVNAHGALRAGVKLTRTTHMMHIYILTVNFLALMSCSRIFSNMSSLRLFCWTPNTLPARDTLDLVTELPVDTYTQTWNQTIHIKDKI